MSSPSITPLILTYNEAPNLRRVLERLRWATQIVVLDSGSTDETLAIAAEFPQVRVLHRPFDTFAQQCNWGLAQMESEWVLSLDADYVLDAEMETFLSQFQDTHPDVMGFDARFKYAIYGKPLRGTLYPNRKVLYRRSHAKYQDDGHSHKVQITGKIEQLPGYIHHDDRKSLSRWLWAQDRYAQQELLKFQASGAVHSRFNDWIRKQIVLAPFVVFFYCMILKGGILDGWRGWYYAFQRMLAELLLALHLVEDKLKKRL